MANNSNGRKRNKNQTLKSSNGVSRSASQIKTKGPTAKNDEQKSALRAISRNDIAILEGPAGTGKTFLAVRYALHEFYKGKYKRLVFTRPATEAGERLGSLPGDADDKLAPYMIPIFDVLSTALPVNTIQNHIDRKDFVQLPFAFMRGVSLQDSFIIADESQNTTPYQMRMLLTRIGENSKIVVTGDLRQTDILQTNGLSDAITRLQGVPGLEIIRLSTECIVRHPIIKEIEDRYNQS